MSTDEILYVKGAKVWVPHPTEVWESATIVEDYSVRKGLMQLQTDSTQTTFLLKIKAPKDLPPLRNPSILIGQNDLTSLSYLHEPGVLNNLRVRFCERQIIYTYCGIILVAINPYAELPFYGPSIIRAYRGRAMGELEPHIFALAEEAYARLERENTNLSIIVSGESGAGKTVSAKYAMRYFAAVGGSESETQVERKVLASSPIMEAFGNAKTTRNDNSSRFGKFTKLLFRNNMGVMILMGASMQTYLLEKSRVVFQAAGERNYHIFYQLCAARQEYPELVLAHQDKFMYLNQGSSPDIDKVSDKEQFKETLQAMTVLGFGSEQIANILKVLSGILHLGNVSFISKSQDGDADVCDIDPMDLNLSMASEMLKVNCADLRKWLLMRQLRSVNEQVIIPNSKTTSQAVKDALAKHIYAKLFQYIIGVINRCLNTSRNKQSNFIGVLDIYGFETFESNSFEQFCINYANEKLQQQFNQHVFKLEQEEYLKEGITWTMIDFYDNQPCIDLIESKLGVLDLLDEECRMPQGSDESWVGKLIEKCSSYQHFEKSRFGTTSFYIKHFSDKVEYDAHGFLEKNRDTVSNELVNVIKLSELGLCRELIELEEVDTLGPDADKITTLGGRVVISASRQQVIPAKQHKRTVGSQFRESLSSLIATLHSTTPHYVRCIKPNEEKIAFKWEAGKIVQQLRACGVLETVRLSAAGFPSRWGYQDFYTRYQLLCKRPRGQINKEEVKIYSQNIVIQWIKDEDKFRFGNTQIFFRAGQVAYLEQVRANLRRRYIIIVQARVRGYIYRKRYLRLKAVALGLQRYGRGLLARQRTQKLREERAALIISKYARRYLCRRRYLKLQKTAIGLQRYARGYLARKRYHEKLDHHHAVQIQRFLRGYLARRYVKKRRHAIIICQAAVRRFLARKQFKRLKAEAKTISNMQKMHKGFENKIMQMQCKIDDLNRENSSLKHKISEISVLKMKLEVKKNLEIELKNMKRVMAEKENAMLALERELELEREAKAKVLTEKSHIELENQKQREQLHIENEELRRKIDEMLEQVKKVDSTEKVEQRNRLLSEVDSNEIHEAYQRALKDKEAIEHENMLLKEELSRGSGKWQDSLAHASYASNASTAYENDVGYSSQQSTLQRGNKLQAQSSVRIEAGGPTSLVLKLREILEEEKRKNRYLTEQLEKMRMRRSVTEDSVRVSELEVENDKLRSDYDLLRSSIQHGNEMQELEAQYFALQEELRRRRDECIQLKAVLQQQSQSLKSFGSEPVAQAMNTDVKQMADNELMEAFQAQKLVNRQLESELSALTEENNAHLAELTRQIEQFRSEKTQLEDLLADSINNDNENDIVQLRKSEKYLRYELERTIIQYTQVQEELNALSTKFNELKRNNERLTLKLQEHGIIMSDKMPTGNVSMAMANVSKQKSQNYQGVMKFQSCDIDKILQRIVAGITPRVALTLMPGFPAYILFMCIRYTDLINADDDVRDLLSKFVMQIKKFYRSPQITEMRTLWLVNSICLLNLLKQYGDVEEYVKFNTEKQNQQQLKNFNLFEYRRVVLEIIVCLYQVLVKQIQELIEPYIVPAILDNDEIQRSRHKPGVRPRTNIKDGTITTPDFVQMPAWQQLKHQLDFFFKQLCDFGLDMCYTEQIFYQLFYFVCAEAMNCLMLRGDICMWETGMIIRYNLGYIEDWVRDKKMSTDVYTPLAPLNQVSQLLQSRKSEQDVQSICDLCTNLNTAQVLKIMKSYKLDDYEGEITNTFLEKLVDRLNERPHNKNAEFTMDQKFIHPFKVVFKYSEIKLEEIEIPKHLNLEDLLTKI